MARLKLGQTKRLILCTEIHYFILCELRIEDILFFLCEFCELCELCDYVNLYYVSCVCHAKISFQNPSQNPSQKNPSQNQKISPNKKDVASVFSGAF